MKRDVSHILEEIKTDLARRKLKQFPLGLLEGDMGRLLFLTEYALYRNDTASLQKIHNAIERSYEKVSASVENNTLSTGLLGYLMFLDYFDLRTGFGTGADDATAEALEIHIQSVMKQDLLKRNNYDYMIGALGLGMYLLKKRPASGFITTLIHYFENTKVESPDGIYWKEPKGIFPKRNRENTVNFGVAHGILPAIYFLAGCSHLGIESGKTATLAREAIRYIKNNRIPAGDANFRYPAFIVNGVKKTSRHGWCYGDLGIAFLLIQCSLLLDENKYEDDSREIALHSCNLRNSRKASIEDASLCHGSGGLYLQYQILSSYFNDPMIEKTAAYWKKKTIRYSRHANGIGGYLSPTLFGLQNNAGFLGGAAGTGLCLLYGENNGNAPWLPFVLLPEKINLNKPC